ncbi:MAG: SDR family NAD(P)-dependent oxidoreductase [Pseudomonadales bacterium]
MTELFDLGGKVALVTGGSRGLGKAMVLGLADAGADVVIASRKQENCDTVAQLVQKKGREALAVATHLGNIEQLDKLIDQTYQRFGKLDILINNAASNPAVVPLSELQPDLFDKLFAVNVKGPWYLASRLAPRMAAAGGGVVVNVISVGAFTGGPGVGAYTAGKAALRCLTTTMAQEWAGMNIRVNALAPGSFMTDMMAGTLSIPGFQEAAENASLQRRIAQPEEIVGSMLYLVSEASKFTTGSTLIADGGMLANAS